MNELWRSARVALGAAVLVAIAPVLACGRDRTSATGSSGASGSNVATGTPATPRAPNAAPSPSPPAVPSPGASMHTKIKPVALAADATLSCELRQTPSGFEITYTVHETGGQDAYVLDVQSNFMDPPVRIDTPMYLATNEGGTARILQGISPLPPDRNVNRRFIPLAAKLAPHGSLARVLHLPVPLREGGPYDPPDPAIASPGVSVTKLIVDVQLIRSTARAFQASGDRELEGAYDVRSFDIVGDSRRVSCELEIPPTIVYLAPRGFVRIDDSAPPPPPPPAPRAPPPPPVPAVIHAAPLASGATLACEVKVHADKIELTYTVREESGREVYVLDLVHDDARPGNRIQTPIYLARTPGGARIVQGIAPLPQLRTVAQRVIPQAWRLAPGGTVSRVVTIPNPMHETGPYDPPAPAIPVADADIERLTLDVHLMRPTVRGFHHTESPQIKGAVVVGAFDTVASAERVTCEVKIPPSTLYEIARDFVRVQ